MYWKNFTLRSPDEIAFALETALWIYRRVQTGELGEVMDKMRLIEVSAATGDIGPINLGACLNFDQYLLKTADPAKKLWRETGFTTKEVDKMFVTEAELAGHGSDRLNARLGDVPVQSPGNGAIPALSGFGKPLKE